MQISRSKWFLPLFSVALGLIMLAAMAVGGQVGLGFVSLGIMVAAGAAFLVGGRSETIRGLRGDGRDERFEQLDLRATAFTGLVLIVALIVAFLIEVARGHDGAPYDWLGAIAGIAYVLAIIVLRVRG
jgi:hypothetical protein